MGKFDDKIFGKKKFSDILQEIHENQNTRGALEWYSINLNVCIRNSN